MFKAFGRFLSRVFGYIWPRCGEKHLSPEELGSLVPYYSPMDGIERRATKEPEIGVAVYQGEVLELHLKRGSHSHPGRWVVRRLSQNSPPHIRELAETISSVLSRNHIPSDTQFTYKKQMF